MPKAKGLLAKTDKTDAFFLAEFGKHFTPDPSPTKSHTARNLLFLRGVPEDVVGEISERGRKGVIIRSADFWHEVRTSKRPRLSLTGWLRGRE